MALQIRKAQRRKAKLRLALIGPTGSGKTMSALKLAFGLGGRVGLIDTENGSGDLYADLGDYDIISLEAPYSVAKYREAIRLFEEAGVDTIILDSLSHAWAGEGGLLDKSSQLQKSGQYRNSFQVWGDLTPEQNRLVEEMLGSPCHIIATMRTKTEYVIDKDDRGRSVPRKIGLSPVQRDGVEYEFTLVMDIAENHYARASKDRTAMFEGWADIITAETGKKLRDWLEAGIEEPAPAAASEPTPAPAPKKRTWAEVLAEFEREFASAPDAEAVATLISREDVQKFRDAAREDIKAKLDAAIDAALARTTEESIPQFPVADVSEQNAEAA